MGGFGFSGEMIFLFFLALILFGPKKLPEMGRQIGRLMNEFRRASNEFRAQIESEINSVQSDVKPQILPPLKEPLGSIASRIFNPPSGAEQKSIADKVEPEASAPSRSSASDSPAVAGAYPEPAQGAARLCSSEPEPVTASSPNSATFPAKVAPDA